MFACNVDSLDKLSIRQHDVICNDLLNGIVSFVLSVSSHKTLALAGAPLINTLLSRLSKKMPPLATQLCVSLISQINTISMDKLVDAEYNNDAQYVNAYYSIGKCISLVSGTNEGQSLFINIITNLVSPLKQSQLFFQSIDSYASNDLIRCNLSSLTSNISAIRDVLRGMLSSYLCEDITDDEEQSRDENTGNQWFQFTEFFLLISFTLLEIICDVSQSVRGTSGYGDKIVSSMNDVLHIVTRLNSCLPSDCICFNNNVVIDVFIYHKLCVLQSIYGGKPCSYEIVNMIGHLLNRRVDTVKSMLIESTITILQTCMGFTTSVDVSDESDLFIMASLRICKQWCSIDPSGFHSGTSIYPNISIAAIYFDVVNELVKRPGEGYEIDAKVIRVLVSSYQLVSNSCGELGLYHVVSSKTSKQMYFTCVYWILFGMGEHYHRTYSLLLGLFVINSHRSINVHGKSYNADMSHELVQTYVNDVLVGIVVDICVELYNRLRCDPADTSYVSVCKDVVDEIVVIIQDRLIGITCNDPGSSNKKIRTSLLDLGKLIRKRIS